MAGGIIFPPGSFWRHGDRLAARSPGRVDYSVFVTRILFYLWLLAEWNFSAGLDVFCLLGAGAFVSGLLAALARLFPALTYSKVVKNILDILEFIAKIFVISDTVLRLHSLRTVTFENPKFLYFGVRRVSYFPIAQQFLSIKRRWSQEHPVAPFWHGTLPPDKPVYIALV